MTELIGEGSSMWKLDKPGLPFEKISPSELYIERANHKRIAGNIYKGRVENVLPGMQAAFVDIGLERNAFLYVDAVDYINAEGTSISTTHGSNGRRSMRSCGRTTEIVVRLL